MTLLTSAEIAERIALYRRLHDAMLEYETLQAALPEYPPQGISVTWPGGSAANAQDRANSVIRRAWGPLREATLRDMKAEVDAAEALVSAFERGETVDERSNSDNGTLGSDVAGQNGG